MRSNSTEKQSLDRSIFDKDISNLSHKEILDYLDEMNKDFKLFSDTLDNTIDTVIECIQRTKVNY